MAFNVVKQKSDGTVAIDTTSRSLMTKVGDGAKLPLEAFSSDAEKEFISRREAGVDVIVWAGVAGLVGELIGYRGAKSGRKAILANIPFLA